MEVIHIKLKETLRSPYCVDAKEGDKIYRLLKSAFEKQQYVVLSFEGIELVIAAFLNTAIGQLYCDYTSNFIDSHLSHENMDAAHHYIWEYVKMQAPLYHAHRDEVDGRIQKIIEEKSYE